MKRGLGLLLVFGLALVFLLSCAKNEEAGVLPEPSAPNTPAIETPTPFPQATPVSTSLPTPTETPLASHDVVIEAKEFSFSPSTIRAQVGEEITVTLKNNGTDIHNFVVTKVGKESRTSFIRPGQESSVTFRFQGPGRFEFICEVGIHAELGMTGTIIVNAEPS